jgi:hypothetical protein
MSTATEYDVSYLDDDAMHVVLAGDDDRTAFAYDEMDDGNDSVRGTKEAFGHSQRLIQERLAFSNYKKGEAPVEPRRKLEKTRFAFDTEEEWIAYQKSQGVEAIASTVGGPNRRDRRALDKNGPRTGSGEGPSGHRKEGRKLGADLQKINAVSCRMHVPPNARVTCSRCFFHFIFVIVDERALWDI